MGGRSRRRRAAVGPSSTSVAGPQRSGPALSGRWIAVLLLLAAVFAGLRGVHLLAEPAQASALLTDRVVVVGVTGRPALTPVDREVLQAHLDDVQVGAVNVRPRYVGDCAAAGWTTLGAGRRAAVGGLCHPRVVDGRIEDWEARLGAAARRGDARLGTLAASVAGCVAAVGPGAALAAALLLAGYLAHRFLTAGHRRAAAVAVAVVGFGAVLCEGWPTMGTDFGGVVALTPPVLWLLLAVAGVRVTSARLLAMGGSAVVAIAAISALDWARGPDRRSHLGCFVQRILDGDAGDVVTRKAAASADTMVSVLGVGSIAVGVMVWLLMLRCALPVLQPRFGTLPAVLQAALAAAVLGTLLNDGGISVWIGVTGMVSITVGWFCLDHALRHGWPRPAPGRELWTWLGAGGRRR